MEGISTKEKLWGGELSWCSEIEVELLRCAHNTVMRTFRSAQTDSQVQERVLTSTLSDNSYLAYVTGGSREALTRIAKNRAPALSRMCQLGGLRASGVRS